MTIKDLSTSVYRHIEPMLPGQLGGLIGGFAVVALEISDTINPAATALSGAAALPVFVMVNKVCGRFFSSDLVNTTIATTFAVTVAITTYTMLLVRKDLVVLNWALACSSLAIRLLHDKYTRSPKESSDDPHKPLILSNN